VQSHTDSLTGVANRMLFDDRVQQAIAMAKRANTQAALMFIDLDKFKPVNDTYGHAAGDFLLQAVAKRLKACVRGSDTVARIGGDEFVVLLPEIDARQSAFNVAEKILEALNQPFELPEATVRIGASIGISTYPDHGQDVDSLRQQADVALYRAKERGRNRVEWAS
jgi:diguanylate cyclase (GGDEF)-like protein